MIFFYLFLLYKGENEQIKTEQIKINTYSVQCQINQWVAWSLFTNYSFPFLVKKTDAVSLPNPLKKILTNQLKENIFSDGNQIF